MAIGYYIPHGKAHELVLQLYYASKVLEQSQRESDTRLSRDLSALQKLIGNMMQEQDNAATPQRTSELMNGPADQHLAQPSSAASGQCAATSDRSNLEHGVFQVGRVLGRDSACIIWDGDSALLEVLTSPHGSAYAKVVRNALNAMFPTLESFVNAVSDAKGEN